MSNELKELLDNVELMAFQLENRIDALAMYACKRGAPHNVHWIMAEHDKVRRMVRRLHQVSGGNF